MMVSACFVRCRNGYVIYMNVHNSVVPYYAQPCEKRNNQPYTAPYRIPPRSLPVIRPAVVRNFLDHTVICCGEQ